MFRMIKLELKHILKMKYTVGIFLVLIAIACCAAILSTHGQDGYILNNNESERLSGIDAVRNIQEVKKETVLSPQYIANVFEKQKEIYKKYGENTPNEVFIKDKFPYDDVNRLIGYVYGSKSHHNESQIYNKLSKNDMLKFYDELKASRNEMLKMQLGENTKAYELEQKRAEKIKTPFYYYPAVGWDSACDKLGLGIIVTAFLSCTLAVQLFSGNYQNGADIVFRTTKYGRKQLALARNIAMAMVGVLLYASYIIVFILVCIMLIGVKGLNDPIQIISVFSCSPYTIGQVLVTSIIIGIITVISVISIILCISAKVKSPIYALACAVFILIVPTIIQSISSAPNWIYFIGDIFPSSGARIYGELVRSNYYSSIRSPYVITISSIINIILGIFLTKHFYVKYEGGK